MMNFVDFLPARLLKEFREILGILYKKKVLFLLNKGKTGYLFTNNTGFSVVVICDEVYPARVAFDLISKVHRIHNENLTDESYNACKVFINEAIELYQSPVEIDKLMKVQKELDETKVVLVCHLI